jgi:hypothetical protein
VSSQAPCDREGEGHGTTGKMSGTGPAHCGTMRAAEDTQMPVRGPKASPCDPEAGVHLLGGDDRARH